MTSLQKEQIRNNVTELLEHAATTHDPILGLQTWTQDLDCFVVVLNF